MKTFAFFLVVFTMILVSSCSKPETTTVVVDGKQYEVRVPLDFGNGVYYIEDSDFLPNNTGRQISLFIALHPELELVTIASYNSGSTTIGYFLIFEPREAGMK